MAESREGGALGGWCRDAASTWTSEAGSPWANVDGDAPGTATATLPMGPRGERASDVAPRPTALPGPLRGDGADADLRRGGVGLGTPPAGRACRRPPWVRDTRGAWPLGGGARPAFGDGSGAGPATAGPDRPARARPGGCGAAAPAGRRPARRHRPPSGRRRLGCREGSRCGGARAAFGNGSGAGPATAGPERIGRSCSGGCGAAAPAAGRLDRGRADTSCGAPAPAAGHAIGGRRAARPTAARRGAQTGGPRRSRHAVHGCRRPHVPTDPVGRRDTDGRSGTAARESGAVGLPRAAAVQGVLACGRSYRRSRAATLGSISSDGEAPVAVGSSASRAARR